MNEHLTFRSAGSSWAIPVADVDEIVESPRVMRLPLLPAGLSGVIAVRGMAVPALEIANGADASAARRSAILTTRGKRRVALLVDAVDGIVESVPDGATIVDLTTVFNGVPEGWQS